jgi:predicted nucleic acid-binding protein
MSEAIIADSSCLIGLSKIDELDVLRKLFTKIIIPEAVYYEVVILGKGKAGAEEVRKAGWIEKWKVKNNLAVKTLRLNLGAGESEAIVLAEECKAKFIILDDLNARQTAEELELSVIGTMAVLQKAEEKRIVENLQTVLQKLRSVGFHFVIE